MPHDAKQDLAELVRRRRLEFQKGLPPFWISDYHAIHGYLKGLKRGRVWPIGRSQGGHALAAVAYGEPEPIVRIKTRFAAQLMKRPEHFFDPFKRTRPVVLVVGSIHGQETEGCVCCVNLANLMETGTDLRGRRWDELCRLAAGMRLVLVPVAQPDGSLRSAALRGLPGDGGDGGAMVLGKPRIPPGQSAPEPDWAQRWPMPPDRMELMGTYFNDAGVDLNTDDFFSADMAPETRALLDLARAETPDCALVLHSHDPGPCLSEPRAHVPARCQWHSAQLAALVAERHRREGWRPIWKAVAGGGLMDCFDLPTALHHVSGALPLSFEFPHFLNPAYTLDENLDIGLTLIEEVLRYVAAHRVRPNSPSFNRNSSLSG